jgi:hypothetical protein
LLQFPDMHCPLPTSGKRNKTQSKIFVFNIRIQM